MTPDRNIFDRLRTRSEEVLNQVSAELMSNPRFMKAMEGALKGKEKVEAAAAQAIKGMNIPTRTEFKKALARIEALERQVADLQARPAAGRRARPNRARTSAGGSRNTAPGKALAKKTTT